MPVGRTKSGGSDGATVNAGPNKSDSAGASGPGTRTGANVGCAVGRSWISDTHEGRISEERVREGSSKIGRIWEDGSREGTSRTGKIADGKTRDCRAKSGGAKEGKARWGKFESEANNYYHQI